MLKFISKYCHKFSKYCSDLSPILECPKFFYKRVTPDEIIAAEKFYKKYLGSGFHMYREDIDNYNNYCLLNVPKAIEKI